MAMSSAEALIFINKNFFNMKKRSLKVKVMNLAKKDLLQTKGGARSAHDLDEVTQTAKKKVL